MAQPQPLNRRRNRANLASLGLILALLWLVLSGHFSGLMLGLGLASILLILGLHLRMDLVDKEAPSLQFGVALIPYWGWLLKEVVVSNLDVIKRIWLGPGSIHPVVKCLPVCQQTDICRVIYANSITLTPGTITIDLDDEHIRIHALTPQGLATLEGGEMSRRVKALEG